MLTYTDSKMIGIRILLKAEELNGDYYVKYEFSDINWKVDAKKILPYFIENPDCKIQTLHCILEYNTELYNIWIDNYFFKLDDLLSV
jgi:hypothetical protein